ncbi:MAG: MarR family winged helix-turn-helix transcriptional regulator [Alphaproteobacteria bacterium]
MAAKRTTPELIDHIGWDLWRATDVWTRRLTEEMVNHGFTWFGEARGKLIQHIGMSGLPQNALAQKAGMSKQAVQQQLDDLAADGIVERVPDPGDARRKLVQLTQEGLRALEVANKIKRTIESDYRHLVGDRAFETMKRALETIIGSSRRD